MHIDDGIHHDDIHKFIDIHEDDIHKGKTKR